jgi:5-methylcytosine-specific restriction enzyme B
MNTFDKASLYEMSYAFMRRFAFIPVDVPTNINFDLFKHYIEIWNYAIVEEICSGFQPPG